MKSVNKIIVCFTIIVLLFIGVISASALNNTVRKEQKEQNIVMNSNGKEDRLKILLMEEIYNVQKKDIPEIRDDGYKKALIEKCIKTINEKSYDSNKQFIVDNFILIWPEAILYGNAGGEYETKNSNGGKWPMMYNLLMNWPSNVKVNDALLVEIEDYKLIEIVNIKEPLSSDVPPTEDSIRKSMEEKQKLIDEAKFELPAAEDIPPTEESIRESMEEKKRLIEEFEKSLPKSVDIPSTDEMRRKNLEEKQKLLEQMLEELQPRDLPPTPESIKESEDEKKRLIEEFIKSFSKSAVDIPATDEMRRNP